MYEAFMDGVPMDGVPMDGVPMDDAHMDDALPSDKIRKRANAFLLSAWSSCVGTDGVWHTEGLSVTMASVECVWPMGERTRHRAGF